MANWFSSAIGTAAHQVSSLGKSVVKTTSDVGKSVGQTAIEVGQTIGETTSSLFHSVQEWLPFSNEDTLAFLAVLFAVAKIDRKIDEAELAMVMSSPEAAKLSSTEREELQSYSYNPPPLEESLAKLENANQELKFGLIFCLLNLIWINGVMTPTEEEALKTAQQAFEINDVQVETIRDYIAVLAKAREEQTPEAIVEVKAANERLQRVGIPTQALAHSKEPADSGEVKYSDQRFLDKMKAFGLQAGQGLVEQAFVLWYALHDAETPTSAKIKIVGALTYWILPVDMLPDILPAVGFTDDFTAMTTVVGTIATNITPQVREKAKQRTEELFAGKGVPESDIDEFDEELT